MWWKARDRARRRNGDTPAVDEVDGRLLGLLAEDATLTYAELGKRLNLSAPAVHERSRRLKQAAGVTIFSRQVLQPSIVEHGLGQQPLQLGVLAETRSAAKCEAFARCG